MTVTSHSGYSDESLAKAACDGINANWNGTGALPCPGIRKYYNFFRLCRKPLEYSTNYQYSAWAATYTPTTTSTSTNIIGNQNGQCAYSEMDLSQFGKTFAMSGSAKRTAVDAATWAAYMAPANQICYATTAAPANIIATCSDATAACKAACAGGASCDLNPSQPNCAGYDACSILTPAPVAPDISTKCGQVVDDLKNCKVACDKDGWGAKCLKYPSVDNCDDYKPCSVLTAPPAPAGLAATCATATVASLVECAAGCLTGAQSCTVNPLAKGENPNCASYTACNAALEVPYKSSSSIRSACNSPTAACAAVCEKPLAICTHVRGVTTDWRQYEAGNCYDYVRECRVLTASQPPSDLGSTCRTPSTACVATCNKPLAACQLPTSPLNNETHVWCADWTAGCAVLTVSAAPADLATTCAPGAPPTEACKTACKAGDACAEDIFPSQANCAGYAPCNAVLARAAPYAVRFRSGPPDAAFMKTCALGVSCSTWGNGPAVNPEQSNCAGWKSGCNDLITPTAPKNVAASCMSATAGCASVCGGDTRTTQCTVNPTQSACAGYAACAVLIAPPAPANLASTCTSHSAACIAACAHGIAACELSNQANCDGYKVCGTTHVVQVPSSVPSSFGVKYNFADKAYTGTDKALYGIYMNMAAMKATQAKAQLTLTAKMDSQFATLKTLLVARRLRLGLSPMDPEDPNFNTNGGGGTHGGNNIDGAGGNGGNDGTGTGPIIGAVVAVLAVAAIAIVAIFVVVRRRKATAAHQLSLPARGVEMQSPDARLQAHDSLSQQGASGANERAWRDHSGEKVVNPLWEAIDQKDKQPQGRLGVKKSTSLIESTHDSAHEVSFEDVAEEDTKEAEAEEGGAHMFL